jgi:hypothetical protein
MMETQCPRCKGEFRTDMDISVRTHGLIVFRGRMICLGRLEDSNALLDFVSNALNQKPTLHKKELICCLVKECGIPEHDATHIVGQLLKEGMLSEGVECLCFH